MRVYELIVRLRSPAIITSRTGSRGYVKPMNYIPGTTLRGAIITALYNEGAIDMDFIKMEHKNPSITASPAYPYSRELGRTLPATPLHSYCKICKEATSIHHITELAREAARSGDLPGQAFNPTCSSGHYATEIIHPKPISFKDPDPDKVTLGGFFSVNVGISRHRASSAHGMLFNYEALKPETKFWATVAMRYDGVEIDEGLGIAVGRGVTRGFGHAEVEKVREIDLKELASIISNTMSEDYSLMYSRSPVASIDGWSYHTYPENITLGESILKVKRVYGRESNIHLGWDMRLNRERPVLRGLVPGSILLVSCVNPKPDEIAKLALTGTIENLMDNPFTGLNMLIPILALTEQGVFQGA